jgi:hypothetical protein
MVCVQVDYVRMEFGYLGGQKCFQPEFLSEAGNVLSVLN